MSLSGIFGSKKKTLDYSEPQQHTTEWQNDYVFVEKVENLQARSESGGSRHSPALPYSLAPDMGMISHTSTKDTMNTCHQNFLYGVPFKLYSEHVSCDVVNRRMMHASEVIRRISQLNLRLFEYDFLVEKSVVMEARDRELY
jgi:hypothetical protein